MASFEASSCHAICSYILVGTICDIVVTRCNLVVKTYDLVVYLYLF